MAVAYFTHWAQSDQEKAGRIASFINSKLQGRVPEGGLYHAEGPDGQGGYWTFNVWTSAEARDSFVDQTLKPALESESSPLGDVRILEVSWDSQTLGGLN
jgi:hypothetical protein